MGSGAGALVNGLRLTTAVLHTGDQIAFGRDHFLIEAPGMPLRGEVPAPAAGEYHESDTTDAVAAPPDARGSLWWLIGAAALIALGLVWILLRGAKAAKRRDSRRIARVLRCGIMRAGPSGGLA
jgi:hypothetical protein